MRLIKAELHNYRQHVDLDVKFTGNVIAIIGANGSGKSNFQGALQFALTGEQPGFTRSDILNWGAARRGEGGYVRLWFTHAGHDCLVERRIENAGCALTVDGEKITGAKKVEEELLKLGIEKEMFRQSVFVRQAETDACLFDEPRVKEMNFQKLIGLAQAATIRKNLQTYLSSLPASENYDDAIRQSEQQLKEAEDRLVETTALRDTTSAKLLNLPKQAEILAMIAQGESSIQQINDARRAKAAIDEATRQLEASGDVFELAERQPPSRGDFNPTLDRAKLDALRQWREYNTKMPLLKEALSEVEKGAQELEKEGKPEDMNGEIQALSDSINKKLGAQSVLRGFLDKCPAGASVCPLCGSTVAYDIKEHLQKRIAEADVTAEKAKHDELLRKANDLRQKILLAASRFSSAKMALDKAQAGMDVILKAHPDVATYDEAALLKRIDDAKNADAAASAEAARIASARREAQRLQAAAMAAEKAFEPYSGWDFSRLDSDETGIKAQMEEQRKLLDQRIDLDREASRLSGIVATLTDQTNDLVKAINGLKAKNEANKVFAKREEVLEHVRDWFDYRNGPRKAMRQRLEELVSGINAYLDKFCAPFIVEAGEEGVDLRIVFTEKDDVPDEPPPATMLSGGQKMALAISFRFACYEMFSDKLGLLVLDEPTAYLDAQTVDRFGDLLRTIKTIAQNMDLQILVATHETAISDSFDSVIRIGK